MEVSRSARVRRDSASRALPMAVAIWSPKARASARSSGVQAYAAGWYRTSRPSTSSPKTSGTKQTDRTPLRRYTARSSAVVERIARSSTRTRRLRRASMPAVEASGGMLPIASIISGDSPRCAAIVSGVGDSDWYVHRPARSTPKSANASSMTSSKRPATSRRPLTLAAMRPSASARVGPPTSVWRGGSWSGRAAARCAFIAGRCLARTMDRRATSGWGRVAAKRHPVLGRHGNGTVWWAWVR